MEQSDGTMSFGFGQQQGLGEMRQILAEAEQLVALAHALAGGIHQDQDRRAIAGFDDLDHAPCEHDRLVDAERLTLRDATARGRDLHQGRIACPAIIAPVVAILLPFGKRLARMSSSVIGVLPVICRTKMHL